MYIPLYYKFLGYIVTSSVLLSVAAVVLWGLSALIQCRTRTKVSYPSIAELAFGKFISVLVSILLCVGQILYGTAYLAYIISNTVSMITYPKSTKNPVLEWSIGGLLLLTLGPLVCVRRPERFYPLFVISSVVIILTLIGFAVPRAIGIKNVSFVPIGEGMNFETIVGFIGIAFFAFEGYGIVIPSHQQMSTKKYYIPTFAICIGSVFMFYGFFGLLTSIEVSKDFHTAVTFTTLIDQLHFSAPWAYALSGTYMVGLLPGYLLITYPSLRILEKIMGRISKTAGRKVWVQNALRVGLVAVTITVATIWGWSFHKILVAIGFFICVPLVIIIPAWSHAKLVAKRIPLKIFDTIVGLAGIGLLAAGVLYFVKNG